MEEMLETREILEEVESQVSHFDAETVTVGSIKPPATRSAR